MAELSLSNLTKSYGPTPVLRDVSLDVAHGEFLTLLGPSGCGKSTLLRILAGLEVQDGGSLSIGGRNVDGLRPGARDVAMVFQSYALYPHMTVAANMALPLRMRRLSAWQRLPLIGWFIPGTGRTGAEIENAVADTADALGIGHLLGRKPGQLSGGQRQRVAVGRAMVRDPAVFLMDEPLSNLDAKLRVQMRAEIKELHTRLGVTFIYVTHDQAEAMTLSDRVAVMLEGELLQVGKPQDIYADPADLRVAEFIGSPKINILKAAVRERGRVETAGTLLPLTVEQQPGTTLTIGIRPEAFQIAGRDQPDAFCGRIRLVEHLGSDLFVHLDMDGVEELLIARLPVEQASEAVLGKTLQLTVPADRMIVFDAAGMRVRPSASTHAIREYAR
ncbi:ABC transporter ATP-binding protein [Rhizobium jaguaris]|uniref:ABC transporter ATP-binding protein n=1 Tax=Rhizobium jaguaris TaxID=1312183 RepID=A0A387FUN1_9HYPH|nr:ABC transporter ATP-binding protein [Rhizobium jaguaris]AYG62093.1 ABC transporter ATP-binding protein [Rhizobium jaguaris]